MLVGIGSERGIPVDPHTATEAPCPALKSRSQQDRSRGMVALCTGEGFATRWSHIHIKAAQCERRLFSPRDAVTPLRMFSHGLECTLNTACCSELQSLINDNDRLCVFHCFFVYALNKLKIIFFTPFKYDQNSVNEH